MNNKTRYTIKDIAELAELSRATVDRVIHGRGTVSKTAYDRIMKVLDKIDYKPNLIAQTLKKGELKRVAVLIPDYEYDVYWKKALDGINEAILEYSYMGIHVDKFLFNPFKEASFKLNSKQVFKTKYDGVLVAPVYYNEAISFFKDCEAIGLPYVTFNTYIAESNALCHVGQNLVLSGETAASLFNKITAVDDELLILHLDEDIHNAKHMQEKEDGFKKFFVEDYSADKVRVLKISKTADVEKILIKELAQMPKIKGIFVSTSKVHYVADLISAYAMDVKLIGYDLIDENIKHLLANNIEFLIYQNPAYQANQGITILVDYLAFKKDTPKEKMLPIEIIIKENCGNY